MKFSTSVALALFAGVFAEPIDVSKRDLQTITGVISKVSDSTSKLDSDIKSLTAQSADQLLDDSKSLISQVNSGTQSVKSTEAISATDALSLQSSVQGLNTTIGNTINDLIGKKQVIVDAQRGGQVEDALSQLKTGAKDLADSITSKVPQNLQGIAGQLSSGIGNSIQKGQQAFQGAGKRSAEPSDMEGMNMGSMAMSGAVSTSAQSGLALAMAGLAFFVM